MEKRKGTIMAGRNGERQVVNHFNGLSFDRDGNVYVVDWGNELSSFVCQHFCIFIKRFV